MDAVEQVILRDAKDGIVAADEAGRIQFFNRAATRVLGKELVQGMPLTELMPRRLQDRHRKGFARYVRAGESRLEGKTIGFQPWTERGTNARWT